MVIPTIRFLVFYIVPKISCCLPNFFLDKSLTSNFINHTERSVIINDAFTFIQQHLGYTDEEMTLFMDDPRNLKVLERGQDLMSKTIIAEVVKAHGCHSGHKAGDKFYFDGAGNLLTKLNPKRICAFALTPLSPFLFGVQEFIYAGLDPNGMLFKRTGCLDTGIRCGGWGHIIMEVRVENRDI